MCRICLKVCLYPVRGVGELFRLLPFQLSGSGLYLKSACAAEKHSWENINCRGWKISHSEHEKERGKTWLQSPAGCTACGWRHWDSSCVQKKGKDSGRLFPLQWMNIHCAKYEYAVLIIWAANVQWMIYCLLICVVNTLQIAAGPEHDSWLRTFAFYLQTIRT